MLVPTRPFLAAQGGRGFTGEGWETSTDYDLIGDPRAVKGGVLRQAMMTDFPATFRSTVRTSLSGTCRFTRWSTKACCICTPRRWSTFPACHPLADIDDRRTFRFRINPNARWSDGMPVVADDVVAGWRLSVDKSLQDPARNLIYSNWSRPSLKANTSCRFAPRPRIGRTSCIRLRSAHRRDVHPAGARPERRDR